MPKNNESRKKKSSKGPANKIKSINPKQTPERVDYFNVNKKKKKMKIYK